MKLRAKLLLGVGILLFAMVVVMYILPTFFVQRDVNKAADQIHSLLIEDHRQLIKSQQHWLNDALDRTEQNINSILFMLYEEPSISSKLAFTKNNSIENIWDGLVRLAGVDPEIGFVQAHSPEAKETLAISTHAGQFYTVGTISKKNDLVIVGLNNSEDEHTLYVAVALPEVLQSAEGYTLYALIDIKKIAEQSAEVEAEISKINLERINLHLEKTKQFAFNQIDGSSLSGHWVIKMDLIRALAPLLIEGLPLGHIGGTFIPEGIARLDTSGNGLALLTEDLFHTTPLFNDKSYFEAHPPQPAAPSLARGFILVTRKKDAHIFIGNTLLIENTFITIGVPFRDLVRQLALSSNKTILLQAKDQFWIGFDGSGNRIPVGRIDEIIKSGLLNQKGGMLVINEQSFLFARIDSFDTNDLIFYALRPMGGEGSIINTLLNLENQLSERISFQISVISLGTMVLVLLFIGRMGFKVIDPITKLAQATKDVVAGRYQDVALPEIGRRRDEVATLTRSFASMVQGLQEREKIRGVLDKVVSKDVADEILRTQIHLGGEDRVVTMLFGDIRGFSEITENVAPQKTIQMLNECMTKISRVIEGEGGVIDKYVGDAVMAIYGAPVTHSDHALRAISSGMLMIEALKRWNQERAEEGESLIEMGIGVHTGFVVAGNMGAEDRLNYTVLGSNVNLAARLCAVARPNQLIISEATLAEPNIEESFFFQPLEQIVLKGFKDPVSIYQVIGFKWEES